MLNKTIVMGRLTRDPELRRTQSGLSVTSFSVACDRDFKSQSGEIVADNVYFGDSKRDGDGGGYPQGGYAPQGGYPQQGPSYGAPGGSSYGASSGGYPASDYGGDFAEVSEDDGELPF